MNYYFTYQSDTINSMIDTNIQVRILDVFTKNSRLSSSEVLEKVQNSVSLVTVKRQLTKLVVAGYLNRVGSGRSITYSLTKKGVLLRPYNAKAYLEVSIDEREVNSMFQFEVFETPYIDLFSDQEMLSLEKATAIFKKHADGAPPELHKKELQRFVIEFSWKSSQIEGNTYDLLSTERLLLYGEKSPTNTDYETQMILNHKQAFDFIHENHEMWNNLTVAKLEQIHALVADQLGIAKNLRKNIVGITGTNYTPLGNEFQIKDALGLLFAYIDSRASVYEKALLGVLGISYIQPFMDGNKRTSRMAANALLFGHGLAPISYRSVDERSYKEACLIFYEQNSIEPFKKLFIEQYVFSANNYNIYRA